MSNGETPTTGTGSGLSGLVQRNPKSTLTVLMLLAVLVLVMIIGPFLRDESSLLDKLADVEFARGVITFIFAIGTIGIAIILTIAALQGDAQAAERFNRGKEVFTILVGIFGTIIGFYFGTVQVKGEEGEGRALAVTRLEATVEGQGADRRLAIEADIEGGSPGYAYSLGFDPETAAAVEDGESGDGEVRVSTALTAGVAGKVTVTIEVSDEEGARAERSTEIEVPAAEPAEVTSMLEVPALWRRPAEGCLAA